MSNIFKVRPGFHIPAREPIKPIKSNEMIKHLRTRAKALGYRLRILHGGTAYHLIGEDGTGLGCNKTDDLFDLFSTLTQELDVIDRHRDGLKKLQ